MGQEIQENKDLPEKKHEGQVCCDASQKSVNFNEDRGLQGSSNLTFLCFFFFDELGSFSCSEINEVNNTYNTILTKQEVICCDNILRDYIFRN